MSDKTDAWMPLWIGAYLADTMKLTTVQHGAYLLLLMAYWRERSPLPDDDDELRSITKTDKGEWKRIRPVMAKFFKVDGGVWWHKRVEHEIASANERSKKAVEKAEKAAQARWGAKPKNAPSNAPSIPQALPEDVHEECPTPSPIEDIGAKAPLPESAIPPKQSPPACPIDSLIDSFTTHLPGMPTVNRGLFKAGKGGEAMRARWRWVMTSKHERGSKKGEPLAQTAADGIAWFDRFFAYAAGSDFLTGRDGKWVACDLHWLMTASKFEAVLGGKYHTKEVAAA